KSMPAVAELAPGWDRRGGGDAGRTAGACSRGGGRRRERRGRRADKEEAEAASQMRRRREVRSCWCGGADGLGVRGRRQHFLIFL
ncbi:UNVERIFIED_CONTAM: hypothetical protein Sradi_5436300, partial [Sesamum radiatum]